LKWRRKQEQYSSGATYEGKKNGYKVRIGEKRIGFSAEVMGYYFVAYGDELNYNSLWNDIYYETVEKAQSAAEAWTIAAKDDEKRCK
jgi:hypothetical protein